MWVGYALLPLLLIPAAVGANAALRHAAPTAARTALVFAVIAAISMLVGLARWPSVHWELARAFETASPDTRDAIAAVFRGLNVYLGNFIGEFLGEMSLNAFFVLTGIAFLKSGRRWVGRGGVIAGSIGLIAAFRNVTPAVSLIAGANNYVLPFWLVTFGWVMALSLQTLAPSVASAPYDARFTKVDT